MEPGIQFFGTKHVMRYWTGLAGKRKAALERARKSCSRSWSCAPSGCSLIIHYPHLGVLGGVPWPAFDPHLGVLDGVPWPASPLHLGLLRMDSQVCSALSGVSEVRYLLCFPYSAQQLTHLPSSPQPWLTITHHLFLLLKFSFTSPPHPPSFLTNQL